MTGRALLHSEFEAILFDLSQAQQAIDRRKPGEPIDKATAAKIIHANFRLGYIAKILIAAAVLILGICLAVHAHTSVSRVAPQVVTE